MKCKVHFLEKLMPLNDEFYHRNMRNTRKGKTKNPKKITRTRWIKKDVVHELYIIFFNFVAMIVMIINVDRETHRSKWVTAQHSPESMCLIYPDILCKNTNIHDIMIDYGSSGNHCIALNFISTSFLYYVQFTKTYGDKQCN